MLILLSASALARPGEQDVAPDEPVASAALAQARLERGAAAIDQGRFADAARDIGAAISSGLMTPEQSDWASYLRARAMLGQGAKGDAVNEAKRYFRTRNNPYAFRSLISILTQAERWDEAARSILELPPDKFVFVQEMPHATAESILDGLARGGEARLRGQLLATLVTFGYVGPYGGKPPDNLRFDYVTILTGEGRFDDAARQVPYFESPSVFVSLLTDKRFLPLWESLQVKSLTPEHMTMRTRMRAVALVNRGIRHGGEALEAMRNFRAIGEAQRAVALSDTLFASPAFAAATRRFGRVILIEKAYALADLGQAGLASSVFARVLHQYPEEPVVTRLAHARVLEGAGEARRALDIIAPLEPRGLSEPARAVALQVTACAAAALQQSVLVRDALEGLETIGLNAAPAQLEARICAGDESGARKLIFEWLGRSDLRASAIAALQLYAEPRGVLPVILERRRRLRSLIAREDIQAALKPYGRTIGWAYQRATSVGF
jgi:tetratricopeptide (TPR) repeat protein